MFIHEVSLKALEKGLDAASLRQTVIANNLANIDTPGFKKSEVNFEDLLAKSIQKNGGLSNTQVDSINPEIIVNNSTSLRADGNNLDVDQEMTTMAKNQIYYDVLVSQIASQLGILRVVISEKP